MRALPCLILLAACGPKGSSQPRQPDPPRDEKPAADGFGGEANPSVDGRIAELDAALKQTDDPSTQASLHAELGQLYWARACPTARDGLCVTEAEPAGDHCGAAGKLLRANRRAADDLATGQKHLEVATRKLDVDNAEAVAPARLILADMKIEELMAIDPLTGLDFGEKHQHAWMKKFTAWFKEVVRTGSEAQAAYEELIFGEPKVATLAIAAAARIGQLDAWVFDQLSMMEIPKDLDSADTRSAFCDTMAEKAEPLHDKLIEAFTVCRDKAAELGVTGDWPALCERELAARGG